MISDKKSRGQDSFKREEEELLRLKRSLRSRRGKDIPDEANWDEQNLYETDFYEEDPLLSEQEQ